MPNAWKFTRISCVPAGNSSKKIKKYDVGTHEEFSSITEATYWARRVLTIHQTEEAQNEYKKYKKRHGFYY